MLRAIRSAPIFVWWILAGALVRILYLAIGANVLLALLIFAAYHCVKFLLFLPSEVNRVRKLS